MIDANDFPTRINHWPTNISVSGVFAWATAITEQWWTLLGHHASAQHRSSSMLWRLPPAARSMGTTCSRRGTSFGSVSNLYPQDMKVATYLEAQRQSRKVVVKFWWIPRAYSTVIPDINGLFWLSRPSPITLVSEASWSSISAAATTLIRELKPSYPSHGIAQSPLRCWIIIGHPESQRQEDQNHLIFKKNRAVLTERNRMLIWHIYLPTTSAFIILFIRYPTPSTCWGLDPPTVNVPRSYDPIWWLRFIQIGHRHNTPYRRSLKIDIARTVFVSQLRSQFIYFAHFFGAICWSDNKLSSKPDCCGAICL